MASFRAKRAVQRRIRGEVNTPQPTMNPSNESYFILSDINGRFNHILKMADYATLCQCRSIDEFIVKLNHHFPFINEDIQFSTRELRSLLCRNILAELDEFSDSDIPILEYFRDYNRIVAFFKTLETGNDIHLVGTAEEFLGLSTCRTFQEAYRIYLENSSIRKYFKNIRGAETAEEKDLQGLLSLVLKNYFDFHYHKIASGYFKEIIEAEGSRQIFELCLCGRERVPEEWFPEASTFSGRVKKTLAGMKSLDEIKQVLSPDGADPIATIMKEQMRVYFEAFKQYDDLSCLYSYFRLKEQEMNNVLWIAECMVQQNYDAMGACILWM